MTRPRLFVGLVLLHAALLLGWAATLEQARARATVVRLEVVPVDPRDLLRGEYVWLRYAISALRETQFVNAKPEWSDVGRTVYIALAPKDWRAVVVAASLDRAALRLEPGQHLIVGRLRHGATGGGAIAPLGVDYGIERYYVPEGKGTILAGRVEAEIALTECGRPFLTRLFVDGRPFP